ncbi:MAG: biotin carboxylase N-terminal domain-containing protein, partial [Gammaproteobacteria bacterium]
MQLIDIETEVPESVVISNMLIANRGEISIRIARAATDLGIRSVAIFTEDDADSLHTRVADVAHALPGKG